MLNKLNYTNSQSIEEHLYRQLLGTTSQLNSFLCRLQKQLDERREDEIIALESSLTAVATTGNLQRIVGQNPERVAVWICNAGDKNLFIGPRSFNVSQNLYSLVIKPDEVLKLNTADNRLYKEGIDGIWATGAATTSAAMVTEFFKSDDVEGSNTMTYDQ